MVATEGTSMTLTNSSLTSGTMVLNLSGIKTADLTAAVPAGQPAAILNATAFSGVSNLAAAGSGNAILYSGSGAHSSMSVIGSGNDILIGTAPNMYLSDTGSGHSILIGAGSGGNTLTGNGNDILVSGTTKFDSILGTHIAALEAILAEWTSSASYAKQDPEDQDGGGAESCRRVQIEHHLCGSDQEYPCRWSPCDPSRRLVPGEHQGPRHKEEQ